VKCRGRCGRQRQVARNVQNLEGGGGLAEVIEEQNEAGMWQVGPSIQNCAVGGGAEVARAGRAHEAGRQAVAGRGEAVCSRRWCSRQERQAGVCGGGSPCDGRQEMVQACRYVVKWSLCVAPAGRGPQLCRCGGGSPVVRWQAGIVEICLSHSRVASQVSR